MADDSKPRNPSDPKASASDAAQAPEARPELRIVGASEAGQLIANLSSAGDRSAGDDAGGDDVAGDDAAGGDDDWMEVGDRTLAEVMGVVPAVDSMGDVSGTPVRAALSIPFVPTPLRSSETRDEQRQFDVELGSGFDADDDLEDRLDDDQIDDDQSDEQEDNHDDVQDDDVFPEEMYAGTSAARPPTSDRRFVPREMAASLSASPVGESAAPARRKVVATPNPDDGDGWSSFAGSGPRWRDEAKDWRDVDAEDPSAFGDDQTRVGALDPERSGAADLYVFAEGDPRKSVASTQASTGSAAVTGVKAAVSGAKDDLGVIRIDATKRSELDAPSSGPQQRTSPGGARPARTGSPSGSSSGSSSGSKNEHEEASKRGRAAGLGERIVTGVGLALIVGFIFYIGKTIGAAVVTGLAVLLAALELANALKRRAFRPAIPVIGVGLIAVVAAGMFRGERGVLVAIVLTVISTLAWFLFGVERERPTVNIAATLLAFVYPGAAAACAALMLDTPHGTGLLMAAIVCTVGHDVFAYFCGRFLGRTKLATEISPNKTVEGLVGGMIGSIVLGGLVLGKVGWYPWQSVTHGLIVGFAVAVAAPIGDLIESQLKRDLDIKDMGSMLPGHGGVLDRIDGMLLAVPAVWLIAVALRLI